MNHNQDKLALRISKPLAAEVGLEDSSPVDPSLMDGRLVITPVVEPELSLATLLAQVTEENLHGEVDTGPAVGGEVW